MPSSHMRGVKEEPETCDGPIELGVVRDLTPQQQRVEKNMQEAKKRVLDQFETSIQAGGAREEAVYQRGMEKIEALPQELLDMPLIELERLRKQQAGIRAAKKTAKVSMLLSLIRDKLDNLPMYEGYPEVLGNEDGMPPPGPNMEQGTRSEPVVKEEQIENPGQTAGKDHFTIVWDSHANLTEEQRQHLQQQVASTVNNVVSDWQGAGK
ncbi:hypothetical protein BSKO_05204 [Bryopsis sp. KO-2023]|nr:hypothetical protein BSKO_05204 [Bryopsis sp. KO-2023]